MIDGSDSPISQVVVSPFVESRYFEVWTGSEGPPLETLTTALCADPVYMHRVGAREYLCPVITETPGKFLRRAGSAALGPNAYLFAGEIVARARAEGREWEPKGTWHLDLIVDCGLPLHFHFRYVPPTSLVPSLAARDAVPEMYVAGLAHLSEAPMPGLYQPVTAAVARMQVLNLNPEEEGFGTLRDVPFGYRLPLDPDTIRVPFVFMTLDILGIGPLERDHPSPWQVHEIRIDLRGLIDTDE